MFEARFLFAGQLNITHYDVAPDGNRFVIVRSQVGQTTEQMSLVLRWFDQLRVQRAAGRP